MKVPLIASAVVGAVVLPAVLVTRHLWPAATLAVAVAVVVSGIVTMRTVRAFPSPWMRRTGSVCVLLLFALIVAQWGVAEFGRPEPVGRNSATMRMLTHGTLQSLALDAAHAPELLRNFYSIPERQRNPFGTEARAYLRRINAMERLTAGYDHRYKNELLASPDSELVIRTRFVLPGPTAARGDSVEAQGRLILTRHGGRYVIDR